MIQNDIMCEACEGNFPVEGDAHHELIRQLKQRIAELVAH